MMNFPELILASGSARRHEILGAAGISHRVLSSAVDESLRMGESPMDYVRRLAEAKARAIARPAGAIVLGADTTVVVEGEVFGKPGDAADAERMLRRLAGREHWVYTGICLLSEEKCVVDVAGTRVSFLALDDLEIEEYVRSGEWADKAGGYAIQGLGGRFVARIAGCYWNVVGLPVSLVYGYLRGW